MVKRGTMSIEDAAARLGIGKTMAYQRALAGTFPCRVLKIGRIYRVPIADLERLLGEREPIAVGSERA